jgi:aminopeptidase
MDKRWHELADILVNYSTQVKTGERVMISMREVHTLPLVQAVYEACVKAGAHIQVQFLSDTLDRYLLTYGSEAQLSQVPEIEAYGMDWADVYFGMRGTHNLFELSAIPDSKLADYRKTLGVVSSKRWEKTRWVIVRIPNEDFAQQAETNYETISELFFNACIKDWSFEARKWQKVAEQLNKGSEIHLVAKNTDLRFSIVGRKWKVSDGRLNLPDGEILTAPVTETVEGFITFELPGVLGGRLVDDIHLEWRGGQLVSATASKNEEFLRQIISTDDGASLIGEFAIGTNYGIDRFCKDIFFDEKIGGTVHIALGRSYPAVGGKNQSAIHWDIVKDMRQEGVIYVDGMKVFENGKFLI